MSFDFNELLMTLSLLVTLLHIFHNINLAKSQSCEVAIATRKSSKGLARTHIARTFQTLFRTHIAHVLVCAHVCVCEFFFATHSLLF